MEPQSDMKIRELRARLARGEYCINPTAVADAVMQRASGLDLAGEYERRPVRAPARRRSAVRLVGVISAGHTRPTAIAAA